MTNKNTEAKAAAEDAQRPVDVLVMRANALLDLLNSDFGMSGGIAIEAIRVELEASYLDGLKEGMNWEGLAFAKLGVMRDHMTASEVKAVQRFLDA